MKIVFVYPDILKGANWRGYYYSGIGSLAAYVLRAGHEAELLHITGPVTEDEYKAALAAKLGRESGQIVAFSATTNMFSFVKQLSLWTKKHFEAFTVAGGVHPTLSPEQTIDCPGLDAVCVGEGEGPLVDLADAMAGGRSPKDVLNLWVRVDGEIVKNKTRPLMADLDSLPRPNRSLFNYPNLELEREGQGTFMASRGCPYRCTYCCNDALVAVYGASRRDYVRFHSPEWVINEIEAVLKDYPFIKTIHFDDDILPLRTDWFEEFAGLYRRHIGLPFECNLRPNLVNARVTALLKEAGCRQVRLGIESGNDDIRNRVLARGLTRDKLIQACDQLRAAGILIYAFNMVGLPFEDTPAMLETVKLNAKIGFDETQVGIFAPFPKTKLHDVCREEGLLTDRHVADVHRDTVLALPKARVHQVRFTAYFFPMLVRGYGLLYRLPQPLRSAGLWLADAFLTNRVAARVLLPLLNRAYIGIRKTGWLERIIRRGARRVLYRTEVTTDANRN